MGWPAVVAAAVAAKGAHRANQQQLGESRAARMWSERLSNTAIQRRMEDMRRAGINPILAARFDASQPAASMASNLQNIGDAGVRGAMAGVNSALAIKRQEVELKQIQAQTRLLDAQTGTEGDRQNLLKIQERLTGYDADLKERAAFVIQASMSLIPKEFRDNPEKAAQWATAHLKKYAGDMGFSAKGFARFINDAATIVADLVRSGVNLVSDKYDPIPEVKVPTKIRRYFPNTSSGRRLGFKQQIGD